MHVLHQSALASMLVLLVLAPEWSVATASSQTPADTTRRDSSAVVLEELLVRVGRPVATAGGASAVSVRLDLTRTPPAPTLDQALRNVPFVQVRTNSRGEAQLSLRGAEARQVAVLVDGVPLSLGWDGRADLAGIPVGGAGHITLVRGLSSVLHGPNVLGGVVEVDVSHGSSTEREEEPLRARAGLDHLGGHAFGATAALPVHTARGELGIRGGAGFRSRPGVAGFGELRENSDLRHVDGFVSGRYVDRTRGWAALSAFASRAERGVPPELHLSRPRFWRYPEASRSLLALSSGTGQRQTPLGRGDLEASLGVDLGRTEIQSFRGRDYQQVVGRELADDRTLTLRLLGDHTLGQWAGLRTAATLADVRHDEVLDPGGSARYRQRLWSLGSEIAAPLPGGGRVSGGLALDAADTPESGDKPPLGRLAAWGGRLGANVPLGESVLLHAAASRRARFPSLRELYSGALGRFVPNPELRPERLLAGEAGMTARIGALELQAVAFHQRLADAIVRVSAGDSRFRRENRDQLRSTGLELLASGGWRGAS
ncbi:MAG: TonB-dependent receptor, partial [Gemmatimonadetes bacterium]|nr:TonB-dependent receptor [Gemmatimonadota bacterium]